MTAYTLWLQYLLCMNPLVDLTYDVQTEHAMTLDCGASLRAANRVCHDGCLTDQDIILMKNHFQQRLFSWFVHVDDGYAQELMIKNDMHFRCCFSVYVKNLHDDMPEILHNDYVIQEIFDYEQILTSWIECATIGFHGDTAVKVLSENKAFMKNLLSKKSQSLHFYFGYDQGQAVSTCMSIHHGDVVSLHRFATLPEFRHKGIGSAMMQKVLEDAKLSGCTQAILIALDAGKPLYEKFNFEEYAKYNVYSNVA